MTDQSSRSMADLHSQRVHVAVSVPGARTPFAALVLVLFLVGCKGAEGPSTAAGGAVMKIEVISSAFAEGETIPKQYTADGMDVSPPLQGTAPSERTKSVALIADAPDASRG